MDLKITRKRLDNHFSYDWWKYLALLVASIFLWSLLFTMLAPRLHISKKFEIFFIVNGYSYEGGDNLRNDLRAYLSDEFVEFSFYNYTPDDHTTSEVLMARISVKEGDLYVMPYSESNSANVFASYVDQHLFADLESLIQKATDFGDNVMSFEDFKQLHKKNREYNTAEKMQQGYDSYKIVCQRAKENAQKLQGYIDDYADLEENPLFFKYSRFTILSELNPNQGITPQEEKIWGINLNALKNITNISEGGFLNRVETENGFLPLLYTMGITAFEEDNMPLYYENLAVINYMIENYYI
jgi:hypothetical protein